MKSTILLYIVAVWCITRSALVRISESCLKCLLCFQNFWVVLFSASKGFTLTLTYVLLSVDRGPWLGRVLGRTHSQTLPRQNSPLLWVLLVQLGETRIHPGLKTAGRGKWLPSSLAVSLGKPSVWGKQKWLPHAPRHQHQHPEQTEREDLALFFFRCCYFFCHSPNLQPIMRTLAQAVCQRLKESHPQKHADWATFDVVW